MLRFKNIKWCIYVIRNNINDKVYVGSTSKLNVRINSHLHDLSKNKHHSSKLQFFVNKYGIDTLYFEVLEFSSEKNLILLEQKYIDSLNSFYNIRRIAERNTGCKHTDESIKKMVETRRKNGSYLNKKHSSETILKMSGSNHWNYGLKIPEEVKEKIRNTSRKRTVPQHVRDKISKTTKGKVFSKETILKLSNGKIGDKNPMYGKKGIESHRFGKKHTDETKKKMSSRSRKIIDLNTNLIFNNYKEAAKFAKKSECQIYKYILGMCKNEQFNFKYYEENR